MTSMVHETIIKIGKRMEGKADSEIARRAGASRQAVANIRKWTPASKVSPSSALLYKVEKVLQEW